MAVASRPATLRSGAPVAEAISIVTLADMFTSMNAIVEADVTDEPTTEADEPITEIDLRPDAPR